MKHFQCYFLIFTIALFAPLAAFDHQDRKIATVTLTILDSRGNRQTKCRLLAFTLLSDGGNTDIANTDYQDRFLGLVGTNIPFGYRYEINIRCGDAGVRGTFLASVERPDQFIVLSGWPNLGDYVTGPDPRLKVTIHGLPDGRMEPKTWVKLSGVYLDVSEVDKVHEGTDSADFFSVVPGKYMLLVLKGQYVTCARQIDFLEAHAQLDVSVGAHACTAKPSGGVKVLD